MESIRSACGTPSTAEPSFNLSSLFRIGDRVGSGGFADVYQALDRTTGEDCAVKIIRMPSGDGAKERAIMARREIDIHARLAAHPSILSLRSAFMDTRNFYIVTPRCAGGDLLNEMVCGPRFSEAEIRDIMCTLVKGVEWMHSHGIVHRDLKLENFLIDSHTERTKVKIADFGIAASLAAMHERQLRSLTGSLLYVAPEILRTQTRDTYYDERVDVWSLGVCLYILLCGHPPFDERTKEDQCARILSGEVRFPKLWFLGVSNGAIDLVRGMLIVDPSERLTVREIMAHVWMAKAGPRCPEDAHEQGSASCSDLQTRPRRCSEMPGAGASPPPLLMAMGQHKRSRAEGGGAGEPAAIRWEGGTSPDFMELDGLPSAPGNEPSQSSPSAGGRGGTARLSNDSSSGGTSRSSRTQTPRMSEEFHRLESSSGTSPRGPLPSLDGEPRVQMECEPHSAAGKGSSADSDAKGTAPAAEGGAGGAAVADGRCTNLEELLARAAVTAAVSTLPPPPPPMRVQDTAAEEEGPSEAAPPTRGYGTLAQGVPATPVVRARGDGAPGGCGAERGADGARAGGGGGSGVRCNHELSGLDAALQFATALGTPGPHGRVLDLCSRKVEVAAEAFLAVKGVVSRSNAIVSQRRARRMTSDGAGAGAPAAIARPPSAIASAARLPHWFSMPRRDNPPPEI